MASSLDANVTDKINRFLEKAGYKDFKSDIQSGSSQNNFFGTVYRIHVQGTRNGQTVSDHLFAKTHSDNVERNQRVKIDDKFNREAFLYNEVIQEYELLQVNLPACEKLYFPRCLYADNCCLIVEDLSKKQYKDIDEKITLDTTYMNIMMKVLAKFHALSFALKARKPDKFEKFKDFLRNPNIPDAQRRLFIVEKVWEWTLNALDDDEIKNKLISKKIELLNEDMIDSESSIICHGDYNLRNVLFHYNEQNEPDGLVMIDFQLSYASSPIADILFAIFSSTNSELRLNEYENLKSVYYETFKQYLSLLNYDADVYYPRSAFEADFFKYFRREFATLLVVTRLMCIAFKKKEENGGTKQASSTILDYNCEEAEREFKHRINGIIKDFIRLGYI